MAKDRPEIIVKNRLCLASRVGNICNEPEEIVSRHITPYCLNRLSYRISDGVMFPSQKSEMKEPSEQSFLIDQNIKLQSFGKSAQSSPHDIRLFKRSLVSSLQFIVCIQVFSGPSRDGWKYQHKLIRLSCHVIHFHGPHRGL